jgi:hypothetical protein
MHPKIIASHRLTINRPDC